MTAWYKAGTVTVTNGSATVTGSSTGWASQVRAGDMFTVNRSNFYEVEEVVSNTEITLATTYAQTTGAGSSYAVVRTSALWHKPAELASQMADVAEQLGAGASGSWTVNKGSSGANAMVAFTTGGTVVARVGAIGSDRPSIEVAAGGSFLRGVELEADGSASVPLGLVLPAGSESAPAMRFAGGAATTGIFHPGGAVIGFAAGGVSRVQFSSTEARFAVPPRPESSGDVNLGSSSARWGTLFTTQVVNVSSDARLKEEIFAEHALPERALDLLRLLEPCSYRMKDGPDRRRRFGLLAQDVRWALERAKLDPADHALWSEDETGMQSLAYGELIPLLIIGLQQALARIEELEARAP
jgi:hypothetical protein